MMKIIIDYLNYLSAHRNTKYGLLLLLMAVTVILYKYALPYYEIYTVPVLALSLSIPILLVIAWTFWSGRFLLPTQKFFVVFCLKPNNPKSIRHIHNA
jgi:hypothetical protein